MLVNCRLVILFEESRKCDQVQFVEVLNSECCGFDAAPSFLPWKNLSETRFLFDKKDESIDENLGFSISFLRCHNSERETQSWWLSRPTQRHVILLTKQSKTRGTLFCIEK